jgi:quinone-modifying oxidoreductase subunit QmoA
MKKIKGAYLPFEMAFPALCHRPEIIGTDDATRCKEACAYDAVDLDMKAKTLDLKVGAVVWATGWEPYDANQIDNLGFGQVPNIITNMMMERLAAPNPAPPRAKSCARPTRKAPESVAFVQCAGSRDENHLPYCSYICCMASLKQALMFANSIRMRRFIFFTSTSDRPVSATKSSTEGQGRRKNHFCQRQSCGGQKPLPAVRSP